MFKWICFQQRPGLMLPMFLWIAYILAMHYTVLNESTTLLMLPNTLNCFLRRTLHPSFHHSFLAIHPERTALWYLRHKSVGCWQNHIVTSFRCERHMWCDTSVSFFGWPAPIMKQIILFHVICLQIFSCLSLPCHLTASARLLLVVYYPAGFLLKQNSILCSHHCPISQFNTVAFFNHSVSWFN